MNCGEVGFGGAEGWEIGEKIVEGEAVVFREGIVVLGTFGGDESFRFRRGFVKSFALLVGDDFVGVTVNDEQGTVIVFDFAERIQASGEQQVHGEPGGAMLGGGGKRGERAGEDEAAGTVAGGEIDSDCPAERDAHQNHVGFCDVSRFGQPRAGGAGVLIEARFGWFAFAFTEAAVIEGEDSEIVAAIQCAECLR